VFIQDQNTVRFEMLKALFNATERTFVDEIHGSLLIEPLANADAVTYPALPGVETPATDTHYLESGYAASAISDTNNPFLTIRNEIREHFPQAAQDIVVFINSAQTAKVEDLTDYDPVGDANVRPGADADQVVNLPAGLPGMVIGRTNNVWVAEWDWIPSGYALGVNVAPGVPAPLIMRVDPEETGLGQGLQLVATDDQHPWESSHYSHRFGLGVGNRLNGVAFEFGSGGTYTVPTAYA
jgi:hypothetical protein